MTTITDTVIISAAVAVIVSFAVYTILRYLELR